jgi:hypothetical protein
VEGTVDLEIQQKVSWADEMDQGTGRKEAEDEESGTDDQERAKRITRGTRGERGQSAVRTGPVRQLVDQPVEVEQERSADGIEKGGTEQVDTH